jgi:phospho-N-acetylmuramoyl-pentapeptide-transferase
VGQHVAVTMAVAAAVGVTGALVLGWLLIPYLRRLRFGQTIREAGPASHLSKQGTPTMGGLIFLVPAAAVAVWVGRTAPAVWALVGLTVGYALIGWADDYVKAVRHRSLGLRAREKLLAQIVWAGLFVWWAGAARGADVGWALPGGGTWNPGLWYVPLATLAVLGAANAVNLTDGLDGLAGGTAVIGLLFFIVWAVNAGAGGAAIFATALAAAVVGFLRYNLHPARVFMGDTGSLALGAALAGLAVVTKSVLFLPVVGGVFVLEALSVILQVLSFRLWGRRVLKMSPLHHHFELSGWSEERIVVSFWAAAMILAVLAWR